MTPLLSRLADYKGIMYIVALNRNLSPNNAQRVLSAARAVRAYPSAAQVVSGCLGFRTAAPHCFQYVGALLDAAGLRPISGAVPYSNKGFVSVISAITELPGQELANGYMYAPPAEIVYNICE